MMRSLVACLLVCIGLFAHVGLHAGDKGGSWPMYGGTPSRNMVNLTDKGLVSDWSVSEGSQKNVKWVVELGTKAYGGPVIAGGRVFVGTNNARPRDPKMKGDNKAVLMAFNAADGKFLWQIMHDIPNDDTFHEVLKLGLLSTPVVDGSKIYYVTPACEVICASTDDGLVHWRFDMMKQLGVVPFHCGNCAPLVYGDHVFLMTSNGNHDGKIAKAPSFLALNKKDGKVAWKSDLPGTKIIEGQWSNPTLAMVKGKAQIIFPGGDNYLYAFEPETGSLIWKCNVNPTKSKDDEATNYMISTPVVHEDRLYVGLGQYPDHPTPTRSSHFVCIDITKTGDVSPKSLDAKAPENKGSALLWSFGGPIDPAPKKGRRVYFSRTMSTAAVHDGLVYIPEDSGYLHCLDAKTGQRYWVHDFKTACWGSPLYVDGKVLVGVEDGSVVTFQAGKDYKVLKTHDMEDGIQGTPVVAGGVLYITTATKLYAIAEKK